MAVFLTKRYVPSSEGIYFGVYTKYMYIYSVHAYTIPGIRHHLGTCLRAQHAKTLPSSTSLYVLVPGATVVVSIGTSWMSWLGQKTLGSAAYVRREN